MAGGRRIPVTLHTISIPDVAEYLGVSQSTVRHWVRARRWPNGRVMRGLKLSDSPAADVRTLIVDFVAFLYRQALNDESREMILADAARSLIPDITAREQEDFNRLAIEIAGHQRNKQQGRRRPDRS